MVRSRVGGSKPVESLHHSTAQLTIWAALLEDPLSISEMVSQLIASVPWREEVQPFRLTRCYRLTAVALLRPRP